MNQILTMTRPSHPAPPPLWSCVVERKQVFRDNRSGVLYEVIRVEKSQLNATIVLRPVETTGMEDRKLSASELCAGSAWSRLPDDDGETTLWAGGTRVGLGASIDRGSR